MKCPSGSPEQEIEGLCADYQKLNPQPPTVFGSKTSGAVTLPEIPKIEEICTWLRTSNYHTSLDLRNGYYHIKLSPTTRHKSAFTTIHGKYEFLRIPFGLHRAKHTLHPFCRRF